MPKNKSLLLLAVLGIALLSLGAYSIGKPQTAPTVQNALQLDQVPDHSMVTAQLGTQHLKIEVVNTPASITQGLSGRDQLGADGMLFILPKRTVPSFWMKEMMFDLDMVWLDDFKIVEVTPNVPQPTEEQREPAALRYLPTYSPKTPANMVLEIEAGKAELWGLHVGDKLQLSK